MTVPHEPPLAPEVARAGGLRRGWTTGTCASAATKAAALGLLTGTTPTEIEVGLPGGRRVTFPTADLDPAVPQHAAVVKDAGDDPDVTDGAHVTADVRWLDDLSGAPARPGVEGPAQEERGEPPGSGGLVEIVAGPGVGTVTLPGLGLPVGAPAVNRVPVRMIRAALAEVTARPVEVTLSVPGGEAMAAKTSNARLGIVGGISILGTTGIVRPFSTAAWRASVVQQVDVAAAQGQGHVVLSTGARTDAFARRLLPELPVVCFVEVGDFTGQALRRAAHHHLHTVTFVGMVGKVTKLAAGVLMTHYRRSKVDHDLMAEAARATGAPDAVIQAAGATATARHFAEVAVGAGHLESLAELCRLAVGSCEAYVSGALQVEVIMTDFEGGEILARA